MGLDYITFLKEKRKDVKSQNTPITVIYAI
jgi:hypothetical protein